METVTITLAFTATITINPERWAQEYGLTAEEAVEDAQGYLPQLLADGVVRHREWGVITNIEIEEAK